MEESSYEPVFSEQESEIERELLERYYDLPAFSEDIFSLENDMPRSGRTGLNPKQTP